MTYKKKLKSVHAHRAPEKAAWIAALNGRPHAQA
jgi:hypothetical protein